MEKELSDEHVFAVVVVVTVDSDAVADVALNSDDVENESLSLN